MERFVLFLPLLIKIAEKFILKSGQAVQGGTTECVGKQELQ